MVSVYWKILILLAVGGLLGCGKDRTPMGSSVPSESSGPVFVKQTKTLVRGSLTIPAGRYQEYGFVVLSDARSVVVTGEFLVKGSGLDILVLVMNDIDFTNWKNGATVRPLYNSGRVTTQRPNVAISQVGVYYLVFDNTYSFITAKTVDATIELTYEIPG